MLEAARHKFLQRDLAVRREALEKLWDAWERLKTVEPAKDKKASVKALLDRVSTEAAFRERLENEAAQLTEIGNKFMIRHTETDKIPVVDSAQVDKQSLSGDHFKASLLHEVEKLERSAGRLLLADLPLLHR